METVITANEIALEVVNKFKASTFETEVEEISNLQCLIIDALEAWRLNAILSCATVITETSSDINTSQFKIAACKKCLAIIKGEEKQDG